VFEGTQCVGLPDSKWYSSLQTVGAR